MSISNFSLASANVKSGGRGMQFLSLLLAALASAMFLAGCSSAVGTDLAQREDVLKALRAEGYLFNKFVISTVQGEHQNQVLVSGQLARKTPDEKHVKNGFKVTQYRNIVVENVNGAWQVTSAPPLQREQLSSQQRW